MRKICIKKRDAKKTVKNIVAIMLIISMALSFAACGEKDNDSDNGDNVSSASVKVNASELADEIFKNMEFKDQMSAVEKDIFLSLYNLTDEDIVDGKMYGSTGATAEELVVIEAAEGKLETVTEACNERIEAQKAGFENYVPEELEKLSEPYMEIYGNYVIMIVSDDNKWAAEAVKACDDSSK